MASVDDHGSRDLVTVAPDEPLDTAAGQMAERPVSAAPEVEREKYSHRGFVAAFLGSWLVLIGAVLAFNLLVDPFAIAGTNLVPSAVETDRAIKLTLLEQLRSAPEILVLGSSRSRQAEPAFLRRLTGHQGFNAGVTGGTAADAWVFTRVAAQIFPAHGRRYIWFVDAGVATNGVNPQLEADPRAKRYLSGQHGLALGDLSTYISPQASSASLRVIYKCVVHPCPAPRKFNPDGSIRQSALGSLPEQSPNAAVAAAQMVANIRARPPTELGSIDPKRYAFFERTLAFMNARGERPVIVLNPIYPTVLAELERYGYPQRKAALAYLQTLHGRFDFVLVDCQDIRAWGGSARDFSNPTHVNQRNMRRMLAYIVRNAGGVLT